MMNSMSSLEAHQTHRLQFENLEPDRTLEPADLFLNQVHSAVPADTDQLEHISLEITFSADKEAVKLRGPEFEPENNLFPEYFGRRSSRQVFPLVTVVQNDEHSPSQIYHGRPRSSPGLFQLRKSTPSCNETEHNLGETPSSRGKGLALEALKNISKATGGGGPCSSSWEAVAARFYELASADGMLNRSDFADCIGMKDTKEFAEEILDSHTRRNWQREKKEKISKVELYQCFQELADTSFRARLRLFFDLCDKDVDGQISEEEIKEVILLSASVNKLSILSEQAEEYAALFMTELDRHRRGYVELAQLERLLTPAAESTNAHHAQRNASPELIPLFRRTRSQRYSRNMNFYFSEHWQCIFIVALWLTANVVVYTWKFIQFKNRATFQILGYCVCSAKGAAETLKLNMALVLFPVCRITITYLRSTFFGTIVPVDMNIKFHKLIAIGIVFGVIVHAVPHVTCNIPRIAGANHDLFMRVLGHVKAFHGVQPTYGGILLTVPASTGIVITILMIVTCFLASVRCRKSLLRLPRPFHRLAGFNSFWYSHHLFAIVYALLIVHGCFLILSDLSSRKTTWIYMVFPLTLYFSERLIRAFRGTLYKVSTVKASIHPGDVLALHLTKPSGFKYISGMYMFLSCPSISKLEWHPFSITSAPGDRDLSLHIRALGDWTAELLKVYKKAVQVGTADAFPELYIDGPYGAASQDFRKYDVLLLVGMGIGATPYIGILKDMLNDLRNFTLSDFFELPDSKPPGTSNTYDLLFDGNGSTLRDVNFDEGQKSKYRQRHKWTHTGSKKQRGPTNAYFYWVTREQGSFEWFNGVMSEVAEIDKAEVIELHNYLTSVYEEGDARSAFITMMQALHHAKSGVDILSGTRARTHFARPNWTKVFSRLSESHPNSKIGVFYCGARTVARELRALSKKFSIETSTKFEFHKENF